jgi:hypothetical protein
MPKIEVEMSDLLKVRDALDGASRFLVSRDEMNAAVHNSTHTRFSPLTSTVVAERERLDAMLEA